MLRVETSELGAQFRLHPFRALRLADSHVGAPVAQRAFARPYRSAPGRLREWRRKRHLQLDPVPAIYLHEYTSSGVSVRGLVGTLHLPGAPGAVFPHEAVHTDQVTQLAHRMQEMSLNPAPILLMHRGTGAVRRILDDTADRAPELVYTDRADQLHRIWRITDEDALERLADGLVGTQAVIADGHHRYAAAQRVQREEPGSDWDRTLVMLVDQLDTPLQLCAVHRTIPRLTMSAVEAATTAPGLTLLHHDDSHAALAELSHALVLHDGTDWATLSSPVGSGLLVSWLHDELFPAWGVDEDRVSFHHSATAALARAGHGLGVLLPAPTFDGVERSARSGLLLPQKATSFQPKPHLGVLMRTVPDE